jgi:hypothetical protein
MRTDDNILGTGDSSGIAAPHRERRRSIAWLSPGMVLTLILLSGTVIVPRTANADLTYTWHEDDGADVSGVMTVKGTAQANMQITLSDILTFSFTNTFFNSPYSVGDMPPAMFFTIIPISATNAGPTSASSVLLAAQDETQMTIAFDTAWNTTDGEHWSEQDPGIHQTHSGVGHWVITGATVATPEPSTAVVAAFGAIAFIAHGWSRRRQNQRRQGKRLR